MVLRKSIYITMSVILLVGLVSFCNSPSNISGHEAQSDLLSLSNSPTDETLLEGTYSPLNVLPVEFSLNASECTTGVILKDGVITGYKYHLDTNSAKGVWVRNGAEEKIFIPMGENNEDFVVDIDGVWLGYGSHPPVPEGESLNKKADYCPSCYCESPCGGCYWCYGASSYYSGKTEEFLYFVAIEY